MQVISPLFILMLLSSLNIFSQHYNENIEAKIYVVSNGEFLEMTGFATNKTESIASFKFEFTVFVKEKDSINPLKKEIRTGDIVLQSKEKSELAKLRTNIDESLRTIILLLLYDKDEKIIGKDRIVIEDYTPNNNLNDGIEAENSLSRDASYTGADGVFLKGFVLEETKTKPGRDFFRLYSQLYRENRVDGGKIIVVKEVIALGSNTKIQVRAENDIIFEFFVNPRIDYIDKMVNIAINRTINYFQQLKRNRSLINRY